MKKGNFIAYAAMVLAACYPPVFLYCNNVKDSSIGDLCKGILYSLAIMAAFHLIFTCIFRRKQGKAALLSIAASLLFWNYDYIADLIHLVKETYYWNNIIILVFFLAIVCVAVYRFSDTGGGIKTVNTVLAAVFGVLVAVNVVLGIMSAVQIHQEISIKETPKKAESESSALTVQNTDTMPDVYLFLFDEFSGFNLMKKYYDYTPTEFIENLEEKNFTFSNSSSYKIAETVYGLNSLLSLEYGFAPSNAYLTQLMYDNAFFDLFEAHGYQTEGHRSAVAAGGNDFMEMLFQRSAIGEIYDVGGSYAVKAIQIENYVQSVLEYDYSRQETPRCEFFYFSIPHYPYLFKADGSRGSDSQAMNWQDSGPYLGQYQYVCSLMESIAEKIIDENPDSIIIFMSDHGTRFMYMYHDRTYPDYGEILNCVYYRGEQLPFDLEGLSGPNTLLSIANDVLGTNLEMLIEPAVVE